MTTGGPGGPHTDSGRQADAPGADGPRSDGSDDAAVEDAAVDAADDNAVPHAGTPDELTEAVTQLHALERAVHLRMLEAIRRFDESDAFRGDGALSTAQWLVGHLSVSVTTASEWVRVARALRDLPAIEAVAVEGRLSWDQLAPLTRLASIRGHDEELAREGPKWSARQTRILASRARAPRPGDEADAHAKRYFKWWWDGTSYRFNGSLPTDAGAVVTSALTSIAKRSLADPHIAARPSVAAATADALVELAATRPATEADSNRATVVVHTDAAALSGDPEGLAELDDASRLAAETARRLACDCRWQMVVENEDGDIVRLGRTTRSIPSWLGRHLRHRDHGCRFPGCGRTIWVHGHHIHHWVDGGPTDPDNLLLVCAAHHRLVHEERWTVTLDQDGTATFVRPSGTVLATGPPNLRADIRRRLFGPDPPTAA